MSNWGEVSGNQIVDGLVSLPFYGAWVADVTVVASKSLASKVSLVLGNLTLAGAVHRQQVFAGRVHVLLVAGADGWSKSIDSRSYNNPGGVLKSTILRDAATTVSESVNVQSDGVVGSYWYRFGDKASSVLASLAGPEWWIDNKGVTQIGTRGGKTITTDFQIFGLSHGARMYDVGTEDIASWIPGNSFTSPQLSLTQKISSVRHELHGSGRARLKVMAA